MIGTILEAMWDNSHDQQTADELTQNTHVINTISWAGSK